MRMLSIFVLTITIATKVIAQESSEYTHTAVVAGFGTGNTFKGMTAPEQAAYASGVVDGLLCAPLLNAPQKDMDWLVPFVKGKTNKQVAAILMKFLNQNPEEWDQPLNVLAYQAFWNAAHKTNSKIQTK